METTQTTQTTETTEYAGLIALDDLFWEVGAPSQDPNSDTYYPRERLQDIIDRRLESYENYIELQLSSGEIGGRLDHLAEARPVAVTEDNYTTGLAGAELPEDVVAYVHKAHVSDGRELSYDSGLGRYVQRAALGGARQRMRLVGRRFEVLPNEGQVVTIHVVSRRNAIEGLVPEMVQEVNAAIVEEARAAVASAREMRGAFKAEAASEEGD